jgi:hypothetical protein
VPIREYKIINWYDSIYIGPSIDISEIQGIDDATSYPKIPFSDTSTVSPIGGYNYLSNPISTKNELSLFDGVCGFVFLPEDGLWNIRSLTFNSAVMNKQNNNNHAIKYIGIFNTADIYNIDLFDLKLSNALTTMLLTSRKYYLPDDRASVPNSYDPSYNSNIDKYIITLPEYGNNQCPNGSYYTFTASNNTSIAGYTQNAQIFLNKPEYLYSAIAFDSNGYACLIYQPTGTIVPFPDYSISPPSASNAYYDGKTAINGKQVIVPRALSNISDPAYKALPYGYDVSQCQYEQSMAMTTTALHMINSSRPVQDDIGFKTWNYTARNAPVSISANISEYLVTLDSYFTIFKFPLTGPRILTKSATIMIDEIFPIGEGIHLAAYATNNNMLYQSFGNNVVSTQKGIIFMGISSNNLVTNNLTFKVYSITDINDTPTVNSTGIVYDLQVSVSNTLPVNEIIQNFQQINADSPLTPYAIFSTKDSITSNYYLYVTNNIINTQFSQLNWNSEYGYPLNTPFYFDFDGPNRNLYIQINDNIIVYNFENNNYNIYLINGPVNTSNYRNLIKTNGEYYILAENNGNPRWGQVYLSNVTATVILSSQTFTQPLTSLISGGPYNAKWLLAADKPYIYGNRYIVDGTINTAWQIFYPSMKITFNKVGNLPVPLVDLTNIEPPEYFHTNMFVYNNLSNLLRDTSNVWGNEQPSNYLACDTQFRGFQFNSYIPNIPLQTNKTYYLAIRGYTPSEQFETLVRFYMPNRYDYRWVSLSDIANETTVIRSYFTSNNGVSSYIFNPLYAFSLINFDNYFTGNHTYGANIIPSFSGISHNTNPTSVYYRIWKSNTEYYSSNTTTTSSSSSTSDGNSSSTTTTTTVVTRITRSGSRQTSGNLTIISGWQGFADFYDQFVYIYNQYMLLNKLITNINNSALSNINQFIITDLQNILPPSALLRQNYNDPLLFSMLFKSGNDPIIGKQLDNWGIGWNLGYPKEDTAYSIIARGNTFFKILDDYVYVRLNDEFNMNKLDISGKENLAESREPTGGVNQYNTKLFLTTFGGYAQTAIMNPISFNPPIGKLDKFSFTLTDTAGNIIDNNDCDWNATLQITEMLDTATQSSTFLNLKA